MPEEKRCPVCWLDGMQCALAAGHDGAHEIPTVTCLECREMRPKEKANDPCPRCGSLWRGRFVPLDASELVVGPPILDIEAETTEELIAKIGSATLSKESIEELHRLGLVELVPEREPRLRVVVVKPNEEE